MGEAATKFPARTEDKKNEGPAGVPEWRPFESLRREIDRLFDNVQVGPWQTPFGRSVFDVEPFWRGEISWGKAPAVDVVEKDKAYEITAELPGIDKNNVEVKFADGVLSIKGEKKETKEEKDKDRYVSERRYGSFQRSFRIPDAVDADKIDANFQNGVLTITLPKKPEAAKAEKKIAINQS
jgi:HSP20 family protein